MHAKTYRQLDHTADLAIEVWGADLGALFENAAWALFDLVADVERVKPTQAFAVEVEADDLEMLLVGWLNELIWRISAKEMLYARAEVHTLDAKHLSGTVHGEQYDPARHRLRTEIKAATYHQIEVAQEKGRWQARVIFDV